MLRKKILSGFLAGIVALSSSPVFANGVLIEDQIAVCDFMEKFIDDNFSRCSGRFQFFYSAECGESLLKDTFFYALELNRTILVKKLLRVAEELHINVIYPCNWLDKLAYSAISHNNKDLLELMAEKKYIIPQKACYLHAAIKAKNVDLVKKFLLNGVDPNGVDGSYNETPLHEALNTIFALCCGNNYHGVCYEEHRKEILDLRKIIKILVQYGANPNILAGKFMDQTPVSFTNKFLNPNSGDNVYGIYWGYSEKEVKFCQETFQDIVKTLTGN